MSMDEGINISERELAEACRRGEKNHQEILYRKYSKIMFNVCLAYTKNSTHAKDVMQEIKRMFVMTNDLFIQKISFVFGSPVE